MSVVISEKDQSYEEAVFSSEYWKGSHQWTKCNDD